MGTKRKKRSDAEILEELEERAKRAEERLEKKRESMKKKERDRDTRRKILAGAFFLGRLEAGSFSLPRLESNEQVAQDLERLFHSFLTRERDRELFGLGPAQQPGAQEESARDTSPSDAARRGDAHATRTFPEHTES